MAEDILVTENLFTQYDSVGDTDTVTEEAQIRQSVAIAIIERVGFGAPPLTPEEIEERRGKLEDTIRASEYTEPPISVTVDAIDVSNQSVTFKAQTNRISLPLTFN